MFDSFRVVLDDYKLRQEQVVAVIGDHADANRLFAAKIDEENGGRPFIGAMHE